jgi:3'(2'), 5'-bisphosphate nucleotidase
MQSLVFTREIEVVSRALYQASQAVMHSFNHGVEVSYKQGHDPVTQADKDANTFLVQTIQNAFPQDAVLAEESADNTSRLSNPRLWCIDPIDGTRDFIAHSPDFIMMVGLAIEGKAALGLMLHPPSQQLYVGYHSTAYVLQGSTHTPLHTNTCNSFNQATCMVSRSHPSSLVQHFTHTLGIPHCIPRGSVGLKMAAVASGEADIYMSGSTQIKEWDTCAPEAILKAAGGCVSDVYGNPLTYNKSSPNLPKGLVATHPGLFQACIQALQPLRKPV